MHRFLFCLVLGIVERRNIKTYPKYNAHQNSSLILSNIIIVQINLFVGFPFYSWFKFPIIKLDIRNNNSIIVNRIHSRKINLKICFFPYSNLAFNVIIIAIIMIFDDGDVYYYHASSNIVVVIVDICVVVVIIIIFMLKPAKVWRKRECEQKKGHFAIVVFWNLFSFLS